MTVSPERKAEIRAILRGAKPKPPPAKPKVVTNEGSVIRDAVVRVAPEDPNAKARNDRVVEVRRDDWRTDWRIVSFGQPEEAEHDNQLYEESCRQHIWTDPNDY